LYTARVKDNPMKTAGIVGAALSLLCIETAPCFTGFEYHFIDRYGKNLGQTSLADVDPDRIARN
jgi:hypothetical protein